MTAASLYLFKGKIKNILSGFTGKSSNVVSDISERVLSNGKKVQKIVKNTKDGAQKVVMNVFDDAGNLVFKKEKVITRSVNPANGNKYINIKKTFSKPASSDELVNGIGDVDIWDINKYYNNKGKLLFTTSMEKGSGQIPVKWRRIYDGNRRLKSTCTYFDVTTGVRTYRNTYKDLEYKPTKRQLFTPKGTSIKYMNS